MPVAAVLAQQRGRVPEDQEGLLRPGQVRVAGIEALVTHTAMGRGFTPEAAKATRGWSEDEWAAAAQALADRGLVDDAGLTEEGVELRARLEVHTDALSADPWLLLGPERTARVVEIAKEFSRTLVANGALSASGLAKS